MPAKKSSPAKSASSSAKTTKRVKPIPDGMHTVTPHLVCGGALQAIAFYKKALGAVVVMPPLTGPDGRVMHASIRVGDSVIMLADEYPEMGGASPKTLKGSPVTLHLFVENVDAAIVKAVKAGATVKMPAQDMFWGDRYGQIEDPFGHSWSIATHLRDMTSKEIKKAAEAACA